MATPTSQPGEQEPDDHMCSEPVGDDGLVICQTATGADTVIGGGEFPDQHRKPDDAAPGGDPDSGSTHEDPAAGADGRSPAEAASG